MPSAVSKKFETTSALGGRPHAPSASSAPPREKESDLYIQKRHANQRRNTALVSSGNSSDGRCPHSLNTCNVEC